MAILAICFVLLLVLYNFSTAFHAYPGSAWPGPSGHSLGVQPRRARGPWPAQTTLKFGPEPSANLPVDFGTPSLKSTTASKRGKNSVVGGECRDGDKLYRPGDKWTPRGGCGRRSCTATGQTAVLGCPSVAPAAGGVCTVTAPDPRHPWPFCCPRLDCPEPTSRPAEKLL